MIEKLFSVIGRQINRSVHDAVNSRDFQELKEEIHETIQDAVGESKSRRRGRRARRDWRQQYQNPSVAPIDVPANYLKKVPRGSISSILLLVFGFSGLGIFFLALLGLIAFAGTEMIAGLLGLLPMGGISTFLVIKGFQLRLRVNRYRRYLACFGTGSFCSTQELADAVDKPLRFVIKDVKNMIRLSIFPDGHLDEQQTCLMLGKEIYQQYLESQRSMKERQAQEKKEAEQGQEGNTALQFLIQGRSCLQKIRQAHNLISEKEVADKLLKIEDISDKIFDYIEKHKEQLPEIRKFAEYYLPTTLKLVETYCQLEIQPVQGENIASAKQEIKETLDTIDTAFQNLLDGLFDDVTMDVSTDISVLEAMLAREGLTGQDFKIPPKQS